MNWSMLLLGLAVFVAFQATAAELALFDVELRTATPEHLHRAAVAGGARLLTHSGGHRVYDASRMGLPGAWRLEVLFDGQRFVAAAYTFDDNSQTDHELRRMLAAKYGPPYVILSGGKRYEPALTVRFYDMADARWDMAPPMQLVYTQHAFNPTKLGRRETRLSYVNRTAFDELEQRLRAEGKRADKARATQLQRTFRCSSGKRAASATGYC